MEDNIIEDAIQLPTEWNHIEAALAYEMELPLLVIHDIGITGGIFDRGTLNAFIYEVDMSSSGWCLEESISGSIKTWKSRLLDSSPQSEPSTYSDLSPNKLLSLKNEFIQKLDRTY